MNRRKRMIASLLIIIMAVTALPYHTPTETVEAAESTYVDTVEDETVLVDNDFSSYPEYDKWLEMQHDGDENSQEVYGKWLAEEIFGEGNYIFGQGTVDATVKIENGALRIIGDNYTAPTDGRTQITKSQFLLSDNASISERGVIIEFDYTLNEGSNGYFALASKPLVEGASGIDVNDIWISGIWPTAYRISLNNSDNKSWEFPGYAIQTSDYHTVSETYKIKIEALPQKNIKLSVMTLGATDYTTLHSLSLGDKIRDVEVTSALLGRCFDDNVRLIVASNCDVTIDNLKVTKAEAREVIFENDFNIAYTQADYNEWLAKRVFGEGNYIFGNADTDVKIDIENGALRIVGVGEGAPTEGTRDNRTQFLVANNEDISEKGVIVEYDYIYNTSKQAIAVASKPLVTTGKLVDQQVNWIAGVWNKGYRACLRGTGTAANWILPGGNPDTSSTTYSTVGTKYNMLLEVTPTSGMKLSAKTATTEEYGDPLITHSLETLESVSAKIKYADCLDDNVRLIGYPLCDVTLDNVKVYLADQASIPESERIYLFKDDFSSYPSYSEWVATQIFGEGNYQLGQGTKNAAISIEDGALRIVGDNNTAPTDGRVKISRTQLVLANHEDISERGVVVEYDYTYNTQGNAVAVASKPLVEGANLIDQQGNWIAGVWNKGYRACLRGTGASANWILPGGNPDTSSTTYSTVGTKYNMLLEVTPTRGMKLLAKTAEAAEYGNPLISYSLETLESVSDKIKYADCLDDNVRLIGYNDCDVALDNLKVTLAPLPYDSNCDEQVTIQDIVRMKKAITDTDTYIDGSVSDSNGNGSLDDDDIESLRTYLTTGVKEFTYGTATYVDTYACGNESEQHYYTFGNSDTTDTINGYIDSYIDDLKTDGYTVQQDNTIGNNRYVTLVGEKGMVHLTYLNSYKSLAVVNDSMENTVYKGGEPEYTKVTDTSLAVMSLNYTGESREDEPGNRNGESFVVTLEDGRYVIVDGGYACDAESLYQFLRDNNKRPDKKIKVAAWFLSHSHKDHYGAFEEFAKSYRSQVEVEYVVAGEGASSMYSSGYDNWLSKNLSKYLYYFDAKLIRPHTGQVLKFCDVEFQTLYTVDDYANYSLAHNNVLLTSENNASHVFQMTADNRTVLFTNDADKQVSQLLVDMYGTNLKSDIFQVNHHGRSGAIKELVQAVNPTYSLWTTDQTTYKSRVAKNAFIGSWYTNNAVADLQSHQGMQYLLTLMGDNNKNCFVSDGDVEIIQFNNMTIK